ncbi:MAG: hypothetical protein NTY38_22485 [Acidobacteria bacterium]|nr:hypothetical protein [Acidobacteriota bacterium]
MRRYFDTAVLPYPVVQSLVPRSRAVLDLLNVKYLLTVSPDEAQVRALQAAGLEPVAADGLFHVFRNPSCWPRAFLARDFEVHPGEQAALAAVGNLSGPERVVLEEHPRAGISTGGAGGWAGITHYESNYVSIRTRSATPALLVLLDSHAPGWSARVNGSPARILAANYAFRAVEVPAGGALVEFRYVTPWLPAGGVISLLSIALCGLLMSQGGSRSR